MGRKPWDDGMKDKIMDNLKLWSITILFAVLILSVLTVIVGYVQDTIHGESVQIEGGVTDYKLYDDYLYLEFNNNSDGYEISLPDTYHIEEAWDFTVKSNMLIELRKSGAWWNINGRWNLVYIIKVPEKPGVME